MGKIADSGVRVVEIPAQEPGLSYQQLRSELAAVHAQLSDCRAVLAIPQILHEVARLIAAEPQATWMDHVVEILEALDKSTEDPAFVVELMRFVEIVHGRIRGTWG